MVRPEADQFFDDGRDFFFRIRRKHDERHLDAPVGRVGDVRDAREAVEQDVVAARDARETAQRLGAQRARLGEFVLELGDRVARELEQARHLHAAGAPRLDLPQAPAHAAEASRAAWAG